MSRVIAYGQQKRRGTRGEGGRNAEGIAASRRGGVSNVACVPGRFRADSGAETGVRGGFCGVAYPCFVQRRDVLLERVDVGDAVEHGQQQAEARLEDGLELSQPLEDPRLLLGHKGKAGVPSCGARGKETACGVSKHVRGARALFEHNVTVCRVESVLGPSDAYRGSHKPEPQAVVMHLSLSSRAQGALIPGPGRRPRPG